VLARPTGAVQPDEICKEAARSGVYRKMGRWGKVRPSRTAAVVFLVGLCAVGAAFVGGTLTGRTFADSESASRSGPAVEVPVERAPQHVFVYGDSLVVQAEPYFNPVATALDMTVTVRAWGGIAPCDELGSLAEDLRDARPHVVVFAFSGNSLSDCMRDESGRLAAGTDILAKYRSDIDTAARMTIQAGVPFIVASPPASEDHSGNWQQLDTVFREIAASHQPYVQYTDAGSQIAPDGLFAPTQRCLPFELNNPQSKPLCLSEGGSIGVRATDGVHFCSDPAAATTSATSCSEYSSGALRYAIALVTAAKLDLDYLATASAVSASTSP